MHFIVQWEKSYIELWEILEKKKREDSNLWMYNSDLNNAIRAFAKTQDNGKSRNS